VVAEALSAINSTGERYYEAELYRLRGELFRQKATTEAEAEDRFCQVIAVASCRQAKSLQLRAVMSLSRLWQRQGKREEARQLLAELYDWLTEGFDTAGLKEAKARLEELSWNRGHPTLMVFPRHVSAEPQTYHLPMEMHEGMLRWPVRLSRGLTPKQTSPFASSLAGWYLLVSMC
jgi:hypothetical protein